MNIAVILESALWKYPPVINLTNSLLRLGHTVTLFAYDISKADAIFRNNPRYTPFDLGEQASRLARIRQDHNASKKIRNYLKAHKSEFDCVWTTTDETARDLGRVLLDFNHVMQMMELVENVSIMTPRKLPVHSKVVKTLARNAKHVVVPEYNRACIQQVWWQLPETPIVLPNKPQWNNLAPTEQTYPVVQSTLEQETRKILLYQGIICFDRKFDPYIKAAELLQDEFALYIMGPAWGKQDRIELDRLKREYDGLNYLGYIKPPDHLAFTHFGYIGLLPYQAPLDKPTYIKSMSVASINALYCAPNKIWEYAQAGIPMLGSNVPGLRYPFQEHDMGMVSNADPVDIAEKIRLIDARHDEMGANARIFFDSVDIDAIVSSILA